jgi:hypothetical protein
VILSEAGVVWEIRLRSVSPASILLLDGSESCFGLSLFLSLNYVMDRGVRGLRLLCRAVSLWHSLGSMWCTVEMMKRSDDVDCS